MTKRVLVPGGAGYIGSHTVVDLLEQGYEVVVADNYSNSSPEAIRRVETITGKKVKSYTVDLCDKAALEELFKAEAKFDFVIHFAGLKAVGESVDKPLQYYYNNIMSTINLLELMDKYGSTKIVFSSSATVYGTSPVPYVETSTTGQGVTNPYGQTKYMIEQILNDWHKSKGDKWGVVILRYFNPIGAHPSGLIGEDPFDIPNNLMPYIAQVAVGRREHLTVFGNDYPTRDGTGIRDYLHVVDLARGHTASLQRLASNPSEVTAYNLGTGQGVSVLELHGAFEKACGKKLPYKIGQRRAGDLAESYSVPTKAKEELGWVAQKTIEDACADTWNWQSKNPQGYRAESKEV